jgi:hypothetical protein
MSRSMSGKKRKIQREFNETADAIPFKNLQDATLQKEGFKLIEDAFQVDANLLRSLYKVFQDAPIVENEEDFDDIADSGTVLDVFNHNSDREADSKRHAVKLIGAMQPRVLQMLKEAKTCFSQHCPYHTECDEAYALLSDADCQTQALHADVAVSIENATTAFEHQALSALLAIDKGCKIYVWPESHLYVALNGSYIDPNKRIFPHVLFLEPGQILLFSSRLVHAGADYKERNLRVFFYIDSTKAAKREGNTTMLLTRNPNPAYGGEKAILPCKEFLKMIVNLK